MGTEDDTFRRLKRVPFDQAILAVSGHDPFKYIENRLDKWEGINWNPAFQSIVDAQYIEAREAFDNAIENQGYTLEELQAAWNNRKL